MRSPPGGLEPPTFRLTAERASQLRHGGRVSGRDKLKHRLSPWTLCVHYTAMFHAVESKIRYGLVVRIPGSHPGGPGSIPGNGIF